MILLTGATGFLGREILGRLLLVHPTETITAIARPPAGVTGSDMIAAAEARVHGALIELVGADAAAPFLPRVRAIPGDLSQDRFGLSEQAFNSLSSDIHTIFHCAAATSLNQELSVAREANVRSTFEILRLAERCVANHGERFHLHHVSTAYVAGSTNGTVSADQLNLEQEFRNGYEQSKAEAEAMVRGMQNIIPVTIYRPSIVVGDSVTGETSAFNVIYIPARLLVQGLFRFFPALPHTPFDVVPVDYVADAIVGLSRQSHESGRAFHLTAGLGRESSPWEIIEHLITTFNAFHAERRRQGRSKLLSMPALVPPDVLTLATTSLSTAIKTLERMVCDRLNVFRQTLPFIPYMTSNPRFDASTTSSALGGEMPPLFQTYAERLFKYCLETDWGKRPWNGAADQPPWFTRVASRLERLPAAA